MGKTMFGEEFTLALDTAGSFEEFTFFEYLKDRKIIFNQQVDDSLVERVIMQILKWNKEDEGKSEDEIKDIELFINTPGGVVDIGLILCEVIKKSKTPVNCTVLGMAASMGSLITMACKKRRAYKFSNVLIHDGSTMLHGTSNKVKDHFKFQEKKDEQIKTFILENTSITSDKYDEMIDREWWLTAENALQYGIIDEII